MKMETDLSLLRPPRSCVTFRETLDQGAGNFSCLVYCSGRAGNPDDEPRQLLDRFAVRQRQESNCLCPWINADLCQRRHHAQRNRVGLSTNRCEEKVVEIRPKGAEGASQCHSTGAGARSTTFCAEAMLVRSYLPDRLI